jgi:hypothetical protein
VKTFAIAMVVSSGLRSLLDMGTLPPRALYDRLFAFPWIFCLKARHMPGPIHFLLLRVLCLPIVMSAKAKARVAGGNRKDCRKAHSNCLFSSIGWVLAIAH